MQSPDFKSIMTYNGKEYDIEVFFTDSFENLDSATQCYAVALNDKNEVLMVSQDAVSWGLPGGHPDLDESYEETLTREVYEEAAVVVDPYSIKPFFYQIVRNIGVEEILDVQLRFIARVKRQDKFIKDPGGNTKYQKYVTITDLENELKWDGVEKLIVEKLPQYL